MSDSRHSLGEALRQLPTPPVPEAAWQRLAESLPEGKRRHGPLWQVAATVLLVAGLGSLLLPSALTPPPPADALHSASSLAALRMESAQWDLLLAALEPAVDSASSAAGQVALADRIAMIDLLLGEGEGDSVREALWSERVLLLRRLYQLRSGAGLQLAQQADKATGVPRLL